MMIPVLFLATLMQDTTTRSFLKTVDIATGQIQTVYSADRRFEAPNWSRDGRYFLINHEGRLYRLSVGGSQLAELPVELATPRINNDHGISPDGKSLVISHEPTDDWLTSSVYVLPIGGGTPRQMTTKAPSFWHGWSPDGKTLAFVGRRDGEFDIYTIPVSGGEERRITTCKGLDDGPDYSPDGAFIYYNSFCSGKMEIWRMRPEVLAADDGCQQGGDRKREQQQPCLRADGSLAVHCGVPQQGTPKSRWGTGIVLSPSKPGGKSGRRADMADPDS